MHQWDTELTERPKLYVLSEISCKHNDKVAESDIARQIDTRNVNIPTRHLKGSITPALTPVTPSENTCRGSLSGNLPSWTVSTAHQQLTFVSQWKVPRSTDTLRIYEWATLEALKIILPANALQASTIIDPTDSDELYDYYQVLLEKAKIPPSMASLGTAIQSSGQWQKEFSEWESTNPRSFFRTSCVTIGLLKNSTAEAARRCIVYVITGGH